jgi:O-antigen/teichoic acid export membrane protein
MLPRIASAITGFISSVLIARGLGPSGFGEYSLVLSISLMATSLSDLGIGQTAIRYASRYANQGDTEGQYSILRWAFRLRIGLILLVTAVFFALSPLLATHVWQTSGLTPLLRLGLVLGIFSAFSAVPVVYFQSLKRFCMNAIVLVVQSIISLIGILVLAYLNYWSVFSVIIVSLIAAAIGSVIFILLVPKAALIQPRGLERTSIIKSLSFWKSPILHRSRQDALDDISKNKFALLMMLSSIITMLIESAGLWIMGIILTKREIGVYGAALRFTLPLTILISGVNIALWPRVSALTALKDKINILKKSLRLSSLLAIGGLLYAIAGPLLAPWLLGSQYSDSIILGQILCIRYCLAIFIFPAGIVGYSFGLVRIYWILNLAQLITVILINILLVPVYGPIGSAIALIVPEILSIVILGAILRKKIVHIE